MYAYCSLHVLFINFLNRCDCKLGPTRSVDPSLCQAALECQCKQKIQGYTKSNKTKSNMSLIFMHYIHLDVYHAGYKSSYTYN